MRIDPVPPSFYTRPPEAAVPERRSVPETSPDLSQQINGFSRPGITVEISPEGRAAYERQKTVEGVSGIEKTAGVQECETCKNRKYQDVSNDPSVSFQSATHISPEQAAGQVLAHEYEHVSSEQAKADREGRRVISQSVSLQTSFCPECGRMYVSGGTTRTVTAEDNAKTPDTAADA
jgi:hypothetical protein